VPGRVGSEKGEPRGEIHAPFIPGITLCRNAKMR
jgi:hypothetical protein